MILHVRLCLQRYGIIPESIIKTILFLIKRGYTVQCTPFCESSEINPVGKIQSFVLLYFTSTFVVFTLPSLIMFFTMLIPF